MTILEQEVFLGCVMHSQAKASSVAVKIFMGSKEREC